MQRRQRSAFELRRRNATESVAPVDAEYRARMDAGVARALRAHLLLATSATRGVAGAADVASALLSARWGAVDG